MGWVGGEGSGVLLSEPHSHMSQCQKHVNFSLALFFWLCGCECVHDKLAQYAFIFTLRTSCGAVYCNRSCLCVGLYVCLWVCYHDNSKLHASIFTKLGL